MNITIIGPGNMGHAIASRALAGGHLITFVGKSLESARKAADEVRASAKGGVKTLEAIQPGGVVGLALWWGDSARTMQAQSRS